MTGILKRIRRGGFAHTLALLALPLAARADDEEKPQKPYDEECAREYMAVRKKLDEMLKAPDLSRKHVDELKAMGEEFARRWRSQSAELYGRTTLYLVQKLGSHNFHDERADGIRQAFALQALERAELMPLDVHCGLAYQLQRFVDASGNKLQGAPGWPAERRRMAELWLRAWRRLEQAIDPSWNREDPPMAWPFFPEVGGSGVDPKSVKDPELRKRYEEAIAENEKKKEAHSRQFRASMLADWFPGKAERFLKDAYTTDPRDAAELQALLEAHVADAAARERVLHAVREPDGTGR